MSKGNVPFQVPDYENEDMPDDAAFAAGKPALTLQMPALNRTISKLKQNDMGPMQKPSPDVSPATAHPPQSALSRHSSRRSYGPNFDFPEQPINFPKSPVIAAQDSDEDSDDSLFAIPLQNPNASSSSAKAPGAVNESASREDRPSLSLRTAWVQFESPTEPPADRSVTTESTTDIESKEMQSGIPASAASTQWSPDDPFDRRRSFVRGDI